MKLDPLNVPRKGGFQGIGHPMHPAIASYLGETLLSALDEQSREFFRQLIDAVGKAGVVHAIATDPIMREAWKEFIDKLLACSVHRLEEHRRGGSILCTCALTARRECQG